MCDKLIFIVVSQMCFLIRGSRRANSQVVAVINACYAPALNRRRH